MRETKKKKTSKDNKPTNHRGYRSAFYTEEIDEDATV